MKKLSLLSAAAVWVAFAAPARATLQLAIDVSGHIFTCVDNQASCDLDSASGNLQLKRIFVDGVQITGKFIQASANPNTIAVSSFLIRNISGRLRTYEAVFSDTGFQPPTTGIFWSGSGTWLNSTMSTFNDNYYADAANGQGAGFSLATPGQLLASWNGSVSEPSQSFSDSGVTPFKALGPYSLTMEWNGQFEPGTKVVARGQALYAITVPEPATWAMVGLGLAMLAGFGAKGRRRRSLDQ